MSKEKAKQIILDAIFLLLCGCAFMMASYLVRPILIYNNVSRDNIAGFYGEKPETLDVIYTGGSCAFTYYNPLVAYNETGYTSYDLAYNGAFSDFYIYLVKEALKTQSPKLYILDLRAFELRPDTYEGYRGNVTPGINSMNYSLNRLDSIIHLVPKEDWKTMALDVLMYHQRWKELDGKSYEYIFNKVVNRNKGYGTLKEVKEVELNEFDYSDECAEISSESETVFRELCEYCSKQSFKTLFIVPPYVDVTDDICEPKIYNSYKKIIDEYGLDYLDCNLLYDEIGMNGDTDYYNEHHTNNIGSYRYSRFLSNYLSEKYDLPDHRDDPDFSEWADDYKSYLNDNPEIVEMFELKNND